MQRSVVRSISVAKKEMLGGVGMTEQELKLYYSVFTSAWKFFRKYSDVKDNDEYWENVVEESGKIVKGYENSRLSRDLILAALSELERISKEKKVTDEVAKC